MTRLPAPVVPAGLGMQTKQDTCSAAHLAAIAAAGAGVVRRGFIWNEVEREHGVYDFSAYDRLIDDCERLGLRLLGCLYGGHDRYEDWSLGGIRGEEARAGFARFAAAAVARYVGRQVMWEVWNEPNVRTFWRKQGDHNSWAFAEEYTALVLAAVPAMRAADPDCFVMAGSVSNIWEPAFQWTDSCCHHGLLNVGLDALSVHPYGVLRPEDFTWGYDRIRAILAKHGQGDLPLLNSERGFSLAKHYEGWSGGEADQVERYQAWHVQRQFLIDQLNDVRLSLWYEWGSGTFGLGDDDHPRPGRQALAVLAEQLAGLSFAERIDCGDPLVYLLRFSGDREVLVAWCAPPAGGSPDQAGHRELVVPVGERPPRAAVDCLGQAISLTGDRLTIGGGPIFLTR